MFKVGLGQDSHTFEVTHEKPLILGGVKISEKGGLEGNSDGDVILHSLCNALSSAIGGDSLSTWADEMYKDGIVDSSQYLEFVNRKLIKLGYSVVNVSVSVEAHKPRLGMEIIIQIKKRIAELLRIEVGQIGITFTSGKSLTEFGLGKGVQALTIVSIKND